MVDATFNWLYKYLTSPDSTAGDKEIDFVIWTGDSSRHDLDPELPRTLKEIYELNRYVASKMKEFVDNGIVVVPCFGNNDVFPHNTMYRARKFFYSPSSFDDPLTNGPLSLQRHL